jgi:hypothetical protein
VDSFPGRPKIDLNKEKKNGENILFSKVPSGQISPRVVSWGGLEKDINPSGF